VAYALLLWAELMPWRNSLSLSTFKSTTIIIVFNVSTSLYSTGIYRSNLYKKTASLGVSASLSGGIQRCFTRPQHQDERRILRQVRLYLQCTYADVRLACAITLCDTIPKKILIAHGITNWHAKRRPDLTEDAAATRLAWCLERIGVLMSGLNTYGRVSVQQSVMQVGRGLGCFAHHSRNGTRR
jgi:hypothetical protein